MVDDKRLRVLIVDDDPIVLEIVGRWLESANYDVQAHSSGFGTTGVVLKFRPDVVLLDVEMPGLNGDAIANLISAKGLGDVQVIFHSGRDIKELMRIAQSRSALGVIQKTSDAYQFIREFNQLTSALRQRKAISG